MVGVLAAAVLFAVVLVAVRALIGVLDRRTRRPASPVGSERAGTPPPVGDGLTSGDPLAARDADYAVSRA